MAMTLGVRSSIWAANPKSVSHPVAVFVLLMDSIVIGHSVEDKPCRSNRPVSNGASPKRQWNSPAVKTAANTCHPSLPGCSGTTTTRCTPVRTVRRSGNSLSPRVFSAPVNTGSLSPALGQMCQRRNPTNFSLRPTTPSSRPNVPLLTIRRTPSHVCSSSTTFGCQWLMNVERIGGEGTPSISGSTQVIVAPMIVASVGPSPSVLYCRLYVVQDSHPHGVARIFTQVQPAVY